ncbi:calcyclin-binding protein [Phlebotomus argentipes]|uniref:calcyclin-binding protein n=1 Tax=Phlebotomus argentipes TaxID=94469 RepID=UPI002892A375|nr:calcyclin-binding protein [Phlebotomus argentipes]
MEQKMQELKKDVEELKLLQEQAVRVRVKDALSLERRKLEIELSTLQQNLINSSASASTASSGPRRYVVELTNYAFDQSDAFVKLFVTLDGVQTVPEEGVTVTFTEKSLELRVSDLNGKDYSLVVKNLLEAIVVEKSYRKIKTDMIALYLKKVKPGKKWDCLTSTEKKVKDSKNSAFSMDDDADSKDPSAGLMNMMKKMYESGDSDTKRMIAKAWTEAQEKRDGNMPMPPMPEL